MSINIKESKLSGQSHYRPEIDGLRAFAVVTVIINHFNKEILPNGYLGVDIFFVISGFVITSSLYQRRSKDFKDFISGFYQRRIKRLVPALSVFVLITSIAICLFNPTPGISLITGLTSLFGLSNLYLLKNATDYFAQSTEFNVFAHTWSLGVEEQFYMLFPFLIWFSGFGRQTKNGARNLFLTVVTLTIISFIGFLYLYPTSQSAAYFLMPTRFWEMAVGCLIFIGLQRRAFIEKFVEKVPPLLVLFLIVGVMYLPISFATEATITVVALSSVLIASLKEQTGAYKFFTSPKVVYIGLISYSLYLWHWGVLSISRWTIGIHWWSVPIQVALMLGMAIASYRWIETPLRKGNWFGKRWKTLVVGGGVIVTLSAGLIALGRPLKGKLFLGEMYKYPIEKTINKHESLISTLSNKNFSIAGNSHSDHIIPLLENLFDEKVFHLKKSFPCETLEINQESLSFDKIQCSFYKDIDLLLETLVKGDFLIISSRHRGIFQNGWYTNRLTYMPNKLNKENWDNYQMQFWDQVEQIAKLAKEKSINVIFIMPLPEFKTYTDANFCTKQWFNNLGYSSDQCIPNTNKQTLIDRLSSYSYKRVLIISEKYKNFVAVDFLAEFCMDEICNPIHKESKNYLYLDPNHLDPTRYLELYNSILRQLHLKFKDSNLLNG
ncbi:acyltransferase family protein [Prochlorococcus sp. MIT 1341]|uniref:acyltransferase family protein n=1 Tax=Prochlorococcus sp. MIT 1341 TaxID=3096221 RepID=UPI002A74D71F|nr:acyltransferase family protein [Prochlorococcus sp. MIT 1341]